MAVTRRKARRKPYKADVFVSGVRIKSQSFETAAEAHAWHDEFKASYLEGRSPGRLTESNMTFGDCIAAYMEHPEGFLKLRRSSRQSMEARLPHFRGSPIVTECMSDFSDKTVDRWLDWILRQPTAKNPGRKSFTIELKYLTVILNWYREFQDARFTVPITKKHRKRARYRAVKPRMRQFGIRFQLDRD